MKQMKYAGNGEVEKIIWRMIFSIKYQRIYKNGKAGRHAQAGFSQFHVKKNLDVENFLTEQSI
ncbi:MAG: hypothetical protein ACLR7D_06515 [Lachnospira eligens]